MSDVKVTLEFELYERDARTVQYYLEGKGHLLREDSEHIGFASKFGTTPEVMRERGIACRIAGKVVREAIDSTYGEEECQS